MAKEEKKRTFESETLALPPLKMVLVESVNDKQDRPTRKAQKKPADAFNEETVMRIIDKLITKD
jgi:hypothetical protein